ncbi:hypothetical protein HK101_002679 [Irineochytrium annulatum]|nr:hypothetical protein HK101_002679 [Irineochytrium annulatum]
MSILHALTDADSPFSLTAMNASRWDVGQLWDPLGFRWSVGRSPMSDLQSYMTNRAPFKLKTITAAHNIILCVWSLAMFAGTLWEVIQIASRYITSGQIFQFCMAFLFGIPYVYFHVTKGCQGFDAFLFSMAVNGSFLVLFIDFYRRSYLAKKKKAGRTPKTEELKEE